MNYIRIGNAVVNMINVEFFEPDSFEEDKTRVFFIGSDNDFAVLDIPFEEFCTMINVRRAR